jgi:acetyltransferase-like isoleucine patch superfamily enzyme
MRNLVVQILQQMARRRLVRRSSIKIHPTAKVNYRGIRLHPDCSLEIGEGCIIEGSIVSERGGVSISIGRNTYIGSSVLASATRIEVGDDILISAGCSLLDHNSHAIGWSKRKEDVKDWHQDKKNWTNVIVEPIKIGNKSWIGLNVIVLKGVEIGEGAVVGAGSVVTKSVPPWTVVAGNPAKAIREIPIEDR